MSRLSSFVLMSLLAWSSTAHGDLIASWTFEPPGNPSLQTTTISNTYAASSGTGTVVGVHRTSSTFGTLAGNGSDSSFAANNWTSAGDYFRFNISTVGFTGLSFTFDHTSSSTAARDFILSFRTGSLSPFTTAFNYSVTDDSWSTTPANYRPQSTRTFDLSSFSALNNASYVDIQIAAASTTAVNGGSTTAAGISRIDNVVIQANSISAVPEPSSLLFSCLAGAALVIRRRRSC